MCLLTVFVAILILSENLAYSIRPSVMSAIVENSCKSIATDEELLERARVQVEHFKSQPIETSYTTALVRGVPQNPSLSIEKFEDIIDNFITRESDVFIATYVKAGTTWTQQIIHCLLKEVYGPEHVGATYGATVPWLEATASEFLQSREAPTWTLEKINAIPETKRRYFKTHATVRDLPRRRLDPSVGKPSKVIAVCRNPKDTVVSLYHHSKSKPEFNFGDGTFSTFFRIFLSGTAENGDWFDHALGWYHESKTRPETHLFLRYEDMIDDPHSAVHAIASFLDIPTTEDVIAKVVKQSSITEMRGSSSDIGLNHLRQGGYGNWRTMFTVQMNELFDDVYRYRMHSSGLTFNFGKNFRGEDVIF